MADNHFSGRLIQIIAAFVFSVALAINLYCLVATWNPMPFSDHWETVLLYQSFLKNGLDWRALFAQHNEHRMVLSNLLYLADYRFFGGLGLFLILVNVAVSCASIFLVCRYSSMGKLGLTGITASLFYLAAGTSVTHIGNLSWPFQTAWFIVFAFAVLAFSAYQHVLIEHRQGPLHCRLLLIAWALAAAASFSNANGSMTWIVLLILGVLWRYPLRIQLGTLIVGGLIIGSYFHSYRPPIHHPPLSLALHHPLDLLKYVAIYAANALQVIGEPIQVVLGAALILFLLVELFRAFAQRYAKFDRSWNFPLSVAAFLLGTAAMTAMGRLALGGPSQANATRYATYGLFLLLSAVLLLARRLTGNKVQRAPLLMLLAAFMVLVTWSGFNGRPYQEARELKWIKLAAMVCDQARLCPDDILRRLYPDPQAVRTRVEILREHRLAQFAPAVATPVPADALDSIIKVDTIPDCVGRVDGIERMSNNILQIRGWMVRDHITRERPEVVSIYSQTGKRLGGGGGCEPREDIQPMLRVSLPDLSRPLGYRAWVNEISQPFYVIGFFDGGAFRCKLMALATL